MESNEQLPGRKALSSARRVVVKIGSALLTNDGRELDEAAIGGWVDQIAALHQQGKEVVLVSSGAVAAGMVRLLAGTPQRRARAAGGRRRGPKWPDSVLRAALCAPRHAHRADSAHPRRPL